MRHSRQREVARALPVAPFLTPLALVLSLGLAGPLAAVVPVLQVGAEAVAASGLTPAAPAYWLGVGRGWQDYYSTQTFESAAASADGAGEARWTPAGGVAEASVWAVVDGTTGELAIEVPAEFPREEVTLAPEALVLATATGVDALRLPGRWLSLLWVRPGVGAWTVAALDEGPTDADTTRDGSVQVETPSFAALPGAAEAVAAPEHFAAGDVLVVIDVEDLTFSTVRWTAEPLAGGSR